MKFTLLAVATLAVAGMANASHPTHGCTKLVTVGENDTLDSVAQKAGTTVDKILAYNHGLKIDSVLSNVLCTEASKTNAKRCLAEKSQKKEAAAAAPAPAASKKTASAATTTKAPSNAVRHIVPNCNKYATVEPSDADCTAFSKRNNIAESDLYKWNQGLHHAGDHLCDNLDTGKAYCVGIKE
ncbi:hypothetical protein BCR42DRAFT_420509 [Absidia repens]|uniref:LysM domain-containing protein n=1 Tax=Absidia repens TaxID=90262 RepID=A0A1X2IA24_9FUNG|nr:hypothetical protein BCR42DRAFT_420509 [Absidia repens]